jgi:peroxiredoxin
LSDATKQTSIAYHAAASAADKYPKRITYVIGVNGKIEHAIDTKDPASQAEALLKLF